MIHQTAVADPALPERIASGSADFDAGIFRTPASPQRFTIAHISDPHLSRLYYREHISSLKLLLRHILDAGCDHLVISGDIVSTADPDDLYLAREIFSKLGFLRSDRLTVVPGNHDIFGGPHRAVDILSFPRHIRTVDYHSHLRLFHEAFAETFGGVARLDDDNLYPFVKTLGPFSLLGLNSIPPWSPWKNPLGTNGSLADSQVSSLLRYAQTSTPQNRIPIAILHHHFNNLNDESTDSSLWRRVESNTMRMRGRKRLLKLLRTLGVRYVLHGHIHRNEIYERDGIFLANGAGAVCDDPVRFLKYNLIRFENGMTSLTTQHLPIPYQVSSLLRSFHKFRSVKNQHALALQAAA